MTNWNDIGSICRAFSEQRALLNRDSSRDFWGEAAAEIERLRSENSEMRRTFGSHPLFAEKDAEIERLTRERDGLAFQLQELGHQP